MNASIDAPAVVLKPDWPAPPGVAAAFTLRSGGVSDRPFDTLNLGAHVGDDPEKVAENRQRICEALALPAEPSWINQVHGRECAELDALEPAGSAVTADASFTRHPGRVCAVLVADCLPVLIAARDGSVIAAAHAGWRGLAAGVLESTVRALGLPGAKLLAWIGPGISRQHFEVGVEVRAAFVDHDRTADACFSHNPRGRWQCDLAGLARQRLAALGIAGTYGGRWCTYADRERFYSHRRDGRCGRMAALIWRDQGN